MKLTSGLCLAAVVASVLWGGPTDAEELLIREEGTYLGFRQGQAAFVPCESGPMRVPPGRITATQKRCSKKLGPGPLSVAKIAIPSPLTGPLAALGKGIVSGAELAIEHLTRVGEHAGIRLELVFFDDEARIETGVTTAKRILSDPSIVAVVGHPNSGVAVPASEVYLSGGLALISPASTSPVFTDRNYANVTRITGRDDIQSAVASKFAQSTLKIRSVYIVHDSTLYGRGVADFFKADAEKRGTKVIAVESTKEKSNFDLILSEVGAQKPDLVYFAGSYDQAAPFFKQAREKGVKAKFMGSDGLDSPDLVRIAGKAVVGMTYTSTAIQQSADPNSGEFMAEFKRKFARVPEPFAAETYDAVTVAVWAIVDVAGTGKLTRETVSAAVRKVKLVGVTGDIAFDFKGDRLQASYYVRTVPSQDPAKWSENTTIFRYAIAPSGVQ